MIVLPEKGVYRSVNVHKSRLDVLADWVEGSVLFDPDELSETDIIDHLLEEEIYDDQDFAREMVTNVWGELERRQRWLGRGAALRITTRRISRVNDWQAFPGHSFCLLLSLAEWYSSWAQRFGYDYTEQGELFECLTKESLEHQLLGWTIYQTGWSRTHTVKLAEVVDEVANRLGEQVGNLERYAEPAANEAGLDLLCYKPFVDGRVGIPVYLLQCASGRNWEDKLHTPNMKLWTKIVDFVATPRKAFATPFAFTDKEFIRVCNRVDGMLLDRYRLLAAYEKGAGWESQELSERIIAWAEPRVAALPRTGL